jgi:DNA-binding HxlR family transcriptional regulator
MARTVRAASKTLERRSSCPVACALDLVGDRWTLLVVRDLFAGKSRYGEFLESAEVIPTNILADRLVRLEEAGIIDSAPYQQNPPRYAYSLTPKGRDLKQALGALALWGLRHVPKTQPSEKLMEALGGSREKA